MFFNYSGDAVPIWLPHFHFVYSGILIIKIMKVMMSQENEYLAQEEFNKFERIMNTQLYLSKEEYDFCFAYDKDIREDTSYVGDSYGDYLNLRLYSEHDHEKYTDM